METKSDSDTEWESPFVDAKRKFHNGRPLIQYWDEPGFREEYHARFGCVSTWGVPVYLARSTLIQILSECMVFAQVDERYPNKGLYLTCSDTGQLFRVGMVPGDVELAPEVPVHRVLRNWTLYNGQTPLSRRFPNGVAIRIDAGMPYVEIRRRLFIATFDAVWSCGWIRSGMFPFLRPAPEF